MNVSMYPTLVTPPPFFPHFELLNKQVLPLIMTALAFIGMSIVAAWVLSGEMKHMGLITNKPIILSVAGIYAFLLCLRYGVTPTAWQGIMLLLLLIFASCSDLTSHIVYDCIWISVLALGIGNLSQSNMGQYLTGAIAVFLPQLLMVILLRGKALGGADIKLSTAIAFLLGGWKGMATLLLSLTIAVIYMSIYNKIKARSKDTPFALIPFLTIGTMILYLI